MRLGAVFPQAEFDRVVGDELVEFVRRLEEAGYDHLLVYDHVLGADAGARPGWEGFYDHRDPFLEPLMLFAYLARECRMELVTDILVLPQRQTALVAKQVATLQLLAPGVSGSGSVSAGTPSNTTAWASTSAPGRLAWRSRSPCCAGCGRKRPSPTRWERR